MVSGRIISLLTIFFIAVVLYFSAKEDEEHMPDTEIREPKSPEKKNIEFIMWESMGQTILT